MRSIKFRGKSKNNREWVYGYYVKATGLNRKEYISIFEEEINDFVPVVFETIGQFTGFHDKNGKEIYEDDIIKYKYCNSYDDSDLYETIDIVEFIDGVFVPIYLINRELHDFDDKLLIVKDIEVIGNKFDNPDLWEEAK